MTARCVRVVQNVPFFPPRTYLEKDVSPSVLSSGDALNFVWCAAHFTQARAFLAQIRHRAYVCTSERMAVQSPLMGASKLPLRTPWPGENVISPLGTPSTKRAFHSPLEPSTTSLRPTVRRLDAATISPVDNDQGNVIGGVFLLEVLEWPQ